ncbi:MULTISPECIES: hypothetical protein [unclassified Helicobacter]|uniref:hypothetical protein n=1 Tax=Helicobacter TaxID=209 RepID=UPI001C85522A|nr:MULTISPECIES: hypothetical protein [unclassified Helicobacter]
MGVLAKERLEREKNKKNCIKRERQAYLGFVGACLLDWALWLKWALYSDQSWGQAITKIEKIKLLLIVLSFRFAVVY